MKQIKRKLEKIAVEAARLATEDIQDDLREFDLMQEESAKTLRDLGGL